VQEEDPAPPPDPELLNRQPKWFKPVFRSCVILSVASAFLLLSMFWLRMRGHHRNVDLTEAYSNVRQIGLALMEFETDYGRYPSPTTRPLVEKDFGTTIDLSGFSYISGLSSTDDPLTPLIWKGKAPDIRFPEL
jgi:hypothetical protein